MAAIKITPGGASGPVLITPNLKGARLSRVNLQRARLFFVELDGAEFDEVDLKETIFEPLSLPKVASIARATNLEFIRYSKNPSALVQLRKEFRDRGFLDQERKITYALSRRQAELDRRVERWFKRIAFEWTCQYGMQPWRALKIWLWSSLFCWIIYAVFLHLPRKSEMYRVRKIESQERVELSKDQICWRRPSSSPKWTYPVRILREEIGILFWAGLFSLTSAFNIGFRDINLGQWLRLLTRTEYELKVTGWARTVAGFQSLVGVYLVGLWVLSYFSRPFD